VESFLPWSRKMSTIVHNEVKGLELLLTQPLIVQDISHGQLVF
jgi:hypothetical protein